MYCVSLSMLRMSGWRRVQCVRHYFSLCKEPLCLMDLDITRWQHIAAHHSGSLEAAYSSSPQWQSGGVPLNHIDPASAPNTCSTTSVMRHPEAAGTAQAQRHAASDKAQAQRHAASDKAQAQRHAAPGTAQTSLSQVRQVDKQWNSMSEAAHKQSKRRSEAAPSESLLWAALATASAALSPEMKKAPGHSRTAASHMVPEPHNGSHMRKFLTN